MVDRSEGRVALKDIQPRFGSNQAAYTRHIASERRSREFLGRPVDQYTDVVVLHTMMSAW